MQTGTIENKGWPPDVNIEKAVSSKFLIVKRCPFCNSAPKVSHIEDRTVIRCVNVQGCGIRPSTYEGGMPESMAILNWNQRYE